MRDDASIRPDFGLIAAGLHSLAAYVPELDIVFIAVQRWCIQA